MPEISRFFGIVIQMYYDEHAPPHFHALYSGDEAQVTIDPIQLWRGELPARALSLVIEWAALHQRELMDNWNLARQDQKPRKVQPLR
jgi:phosphomannomutase